MEETALSRVVREADIPEADAAIVGLEINRHLNVVGGRPSDAARVVVRDYKHNPAAFIARFHSERATERATGLDCFGSPLRPSEELVDRALRRL